MRGEEYFGRRHRAGSNRNTGRVSHEDGEMKLAITGLIEGVITEEDRLEGREIFQATGKVREKTLV
ncbi:MAG: hypothetical protein ACYTEQ_12315 [Planctomycetota bacterium]